METGYAAEPIHTIEIDDKTASEVETIPNSALDKELKE